MEYMNLKGKTARLVLIFILIASISGYELFSYLTRPKFAYIECMKVFDGFKLKKELEAELIRISSARQISIDTLKNVITKLQVQSENVKTMTDGQSKILAEINMYKGKIRELETVNSNLADEYDTRIWKQLNQYIQDYADKYGYDIIFGAKGDATIMAAKIKFNKTKEIIEYVNNKYDGIE
jgi:Skp family chaperone for outer membrane proteins